MKIRQVPHLKGELEIPGDKSISHRSVMFGAIANGTTEIRGFLSGADCLSTISCFQKMGIEVARQNDSVTVHGKGLRGLSAPDGVLDCGNSGTTMRLLSGILAAQSFSATLTGDASIQKRPMSRIIDPLSLMGADITGRDNCAPLTVNGKKLHGIDYVSKVASAQVKSAVLLAGLYADRETKFTEPYLSRNHTELMLSHFGADVSAEGCTASIRPAEELWGTSIAVPGDISSAAFFLAAGLLVPNSEILIRNVGVNPTRDGILRVIARMGGDVKYLNESSGLGEPTADILVRHSSLHGTEVGGGIIPTLIDELPIIAVMACFAEGETVIRDAAELKVKESDRIDVMVKALSSMGADIAATGDGMIIRGGRPLHGAVIDSHADHRIAMTFTVAGLCAEGETEILGAECVDISYPRFFEDLRKLSL